MFRSFAYVSLGGEESYAYVGALQLRLSKTNPMTNEFLRNQAEGK